jgi:hypothetical protein
VRRQMKISSSSQRSSVVRVCAAVALLSCLIPPTVSACPYSVRDVGFIELTPARYSLYCVVRNDTPERDKVSATFDELSGVVLLDSNVECEVVNLDRQEGHEAAEYVEFWGIDTFPSAVVVAPDGRSLVLPMVRADQPLKDTVWSVLEGVVSSPKRDEVLEHAPTAWCMVVLVEGGDRAENGKARKAVGEAMSFISGAVTAMGRVVREPPLLLVIPQQSAAEEEVLLWSLGLDSYDNRGARVAVLYGRGRQMGPVLEGDGLTRDAVLNLFYIIGMDCGCETDPRILAGRTIPLRWGSTVQSLLVSQLGFDPESPMVKTEVSRIWAGGAMYAEGPLGYTEGVFGYIEQPAEAAIVPSSEVVPEKASVSTATLGERAGRTVLVVGGVLALCGVVGGGIIIVLRAR